MLTEIKKIEFETNHFIATHTANKQQTNNKQTNNKMNNNKTPFCKVCFDSGKPDTKHWVKDRSGKVCCPTLLVLKCRLCGQCGHTVKYCTKVSAKPLAKSVVDKPLAKLADKLVAKPVDKPVAINKFEMLFGDSDEEDELVVKPEPEPQKKIEIKKKRWIDYDSDFDDDEEEVMALPKVLPMPTLRRYDRSDNSVESLIEVSM